MTRNALYSILILTLCSACLQFGSRTHGGDWDDASFEQFLDDCFEQELGRDPVRLTRLGRREEHDAWTPVTAEFMRETITLKRGFLEELQAFGSDALSPRNQMNHELFTYKLEREIEWERWQRHNYPVTQMRGLHTQVPALLMNMHNIESHEDAEAYIARLEGVKPLFADLVADLRAREALGVLPPRFVFAHSIGACRNVLVGRPFDAGPEPSTLLADFESKLGEALRPAAARSALVARAERALISSVGPAYQSLIDLLEEQQSRASGKDGAWKLPDGDDYYAAALRRNTTTGLGAQEIHELGLREVARIHAEMRAIQEVVGHAGSLQEFFEFMRTDKRFYYPDTDEGRADYLHDAEVLIDAMKARLPEFFETLPQADMIVKAVEPYRSASAGKAFYSPGSPDGSRPGTYYANLHNMADMPSYQMEALAYHEGIPGHHMQNSIARELEGVPQFRKFGRYTAYGEGWALYTEFFPKEMGFYADPYSDFGRLAMELWRACRLVVDTGMHHSRWTREEAIEYLMMNTPNPEGDCINAIERYIVMPGQATAYKIGMIRILELRARAESALGDSFDIRGFHDALLTNGPLPLELLDRVVDEWIKASL